MKKSLRNSILLLLTAMLLTVSALADSGPKPQLTVKVKKRAGASRTTSTFWKRGHYQGHTYGSGDGDVDIQRASTGATPSEESVRCWTTSCWTRMRAAVPEGWHACTAQGTNGAPMCGDLIGEPIAGASAATLFRLPRRTGYVSDHSHCDEKRRELGIRYAPPRDAAIERRRWIGRRKRTRERAERGGGLCACNFSVCCCRRCSSRACCCIAFGYRSRRSWLVLSAREPCDARRLRALPCRDGAQPRRERLVAALLPPH